MPNANLDTALKCAGAGVPVCPCDAVSGQRLEVDGHQISATTDAETIRAYMEAHPDAVFAIVTGRSVGFVQIRCADNQSHGNFGGLRFQCGGKENTMSVSTDNGGRTFIYAIPKDSALTGDVELDPGVTVCAEEALVMLPTDDGSWALKDGAVEMPPKLFARCVEAMPQNYMADGSANEIESSPAAGDTPVEDNSDSISSETRDSDVELWQSAAASEALPVESCSVDSAAELLPPLNPGALERNVHFVLETGEEYCSKGEKLDWTLKGLMIKRGIGQIFGPSGSGKSFLALDMALCIAGGRNPRDGRPFWYGHRIKPCPVAYFVLEGQMGFALRIQAMIEEYKLTPLPAILRFIRQPLNMAELTEVEAFARECPHGALVIIDTQALVTADLDENTGLGVLIKNMQYLSEKIDGFILTIHHSGYSKNGQKKQRARGDSKQIAAWDLSISVSGETATKVWLANKVKDGESGEQHAFRLQQIHLGFDGDGDPVTSCVAVPLGDVVDAEKTTSDESDQMGVSPVDRLSNNDRFAYDVLLSLLEANYPNTALIEPVSIATQEWSKALQGAQPGEKANTIRQRYSRAKNRLEACGLISISKDEQTVTVYPDTEESPDDDINWNTQLEEADD